MISLFHFLIPSFLSSDCSRSHPNLTTLIIHHHSSSFIIIHNHSTSFIIIHQHSSSFIIIHQPSSSFIINYQPSSSFIIIHHHSSSFIIIHHHSSSFIIIHQHSSAFIIIIHLGQLWNEGLKIHTQRNNKVAYWAPCRNPKYIFKKQKSSLTNVTLRVSLCNGIQT